MGSATVDIQDSKDETVTLKDFIDDHQKVLASIGVLTALAVFWSNLAYKEIVSYASFWCLIATIPLFYEVYRRFDFHKSTWALIIFINLLTPIIFYTAWYVLIAFRPQWQFQMSNLILWSLFIPLWVLYNRLNVSSRIDSFLNEMFVMRPRKARKRERCRQLRKLRKEREEHLRASGLTDDEKTRFRNNWKKNIREVPSVALKELEGSSVTLLNILAIIILLGVCTIASKYLAPFPNAWLDREQESYAGTQDPSPIPIPTATSTRPVTNK